MTKKLVSIDARVAEAVKTAYFEAHRQTFLGFNPDPAKNLAWLKEHFHAIAHQHKVFHSEDANQYNMCFAAAKRRINRAVNTLLRHHAKKKEVREAEKMRSSIPKEQLILPLFVPPPEQFRKWHKSFMAAHST